MKKEERSLVGNIKHASGKYGGFSFGGCQPDGVQVYNPLRKGIEFPNGARFVLLLTFDVEGNFGNGTGSEELEIGNYDRICTRLEDNGSQMKKQINPWWMRFGHFAIAGTYHLNVHLNVAWPFGASACLRPLRIKREPCQNNSHPLMGIPDEGNTFFIRDLLLETHPAHPEAGNSFVCFAKIRIFHHFNKIQYISVLRYLSGIKYLLHDNNCIAL
jgi:hypothetical protein